MRITLIGAILAVGLLVASTALSATIAGSAKNETLRGTGSADVIRAKAGNDRLDGRKGNDRLYGQRGNDRMFGGPGNDRMFGGPGNDRMFGGPGNDRMFGGPGRDVHIGGPGNDWIMARDGTRDVVRCGAGRDVAVVDARDQVGGDCERVRRTGGPARRPGPQAGGAPAPQLVPGPEGAPAPTPAPATPPSGATEQMLALLRGHVLTLIETNNSSPGTGFSDRSTLDLCSDGTFAYRREYSAGFGGGAGDALIQEARGNWSLTDVQSLQSARLAFSNQAFAENPPSQSDPFQGLPGSLALGFLAQPDGSVQTFIEQTRVLRTQSQRCA